MRKRNVWVLLGAGALATWMVTAMVQRPPQESVGDPDTGFTDTPMLPGLPYHVHDPGRPHPRVVAPAGQAGAPPADAIVLFDGTDLSQWTFQGGGEGWKLEDGYVEVTPRTGDMVSKEKFGDVQLHVEFQMPEDIEGKGQSRGNSGVILQRRYEIQVLDSYQSSTYADGQAGAIYGQWPPLVNASRPPGEWQSYDIFFDAPEFKGEELLKPAYFTVLHNGVLIHHHKASMGPMVYRDVAQYVAHEPEDSLVLQNHNQRVRYRNIWVRRLEAYDEPEE